MWRGRRALLLCPLLVMALGGATAGCSGADAKSDEPLESAPSPSASAPFNSPTEPTPEQSTGGMPGIAPMPTDPPATVSPAPASPPVSTPGPQGPVEVPPEPPSNPVGGPEPTPVTPDPAPVPTASGEVPTPTPVDNPEPSPVTPEPMTPEPVDQGPVPEGAQELVDALSLGWNVGNSLDAPEGETAWGNPAVSGALLEAVALAGFDVVRIPVTWSLHLGPAPDYTIDPAWLARVDEVIGYARAAGLYAIINLHHDGADDYEGVEWITLTDAAGAISTEVDMAVETQFVRVWTQIAEYFADHDEYLLFESMNEIHDGYDAPDPAYYTTINRLNQRFVDTVRATGSVNAERFLVVPGYNTNIDYTLAGFEAPTDSVADRLILSVHYYDPWSFAGEASTPVWGAASPGTDDWGQEDFVVGQFDKLKAQYVDQGLPVMIGEYGAVNQDGYENYRRYYMEFVTKAAHDRGFLPVYWDNGGQGSGPDNFGLFDRASGAITQPELVETLLRAVSESYTLDDIAPP